MGTTYFREIPDADEERDEFNEWEPQVMRDLLRSVSPLAQPGVDGQLTSLGVERVRLASLQSDCPEVGPLYCAVVAESMGANARAALASWDKDHDHVLARTHRKVDSIIKKSRQYELQDNLLYRRVFDVSDREVQLRLVAPTGSLVQQEVIGIGQRPLAFRDALMGQYHDSPLTGHIGGDKTVEMIKRDWYWPGLYGLSLIHI